MTSTATQQCIHIIQDFQPIIPFYTNIFVEQKAFTVNEVSNNIFPVFFYASLAAMLSALWLIDSLGHDGLLLSLSFAQLLMLAILVFMRPRKFIPAQLIYALGGASTALRTVLRTLLVARGRNAQVQTSQLKLYRYATVSLAAWVGQEIFNETRSYNPIIAISMLAMAGGSILAGIARVSSPGSASSTEAPPTHRPLLETLASASAASQLFPRSLVANILIGSGAAWLQIFLSIYSQPLLREKARDVAPKLSRRALSVLRFPVQVLAVQLVRFYNAVLFLWKKLRETLRERGGQAGVGEVGLGGQSGAGGYRNQEDGAGVEGEGVPRVLNTVGESSGGSAGGSANKQPSLESGYIEGTTKIFASVASMLAIQYLLPHFPGNVTLVLFPLSILSFSLLTRCRSLGQSECLYFVTLSLILMTETVAKARIHGEPHRLLIFNICLIVETLLHALVGFLCRSIGLATSKKGLLYTSMAGAAYLLALYLLATG